MELVVEDWNHTKDHVDFIGADGRLIERTHSMPARYVLRGGEGYVRAHVVQQPKNSQQPREAWTQSYFITYE